METAKMRDWRSDTERKRDWMVAGIYVAFLFGVIGACGYIESGFGGLF